MEKKSKTSHENTSTSLSEAKSKSALNTARSIVAKPKSIVEPQSARNFCFGKNPIVKKAYQKNSEKVIKPPEKSERPSRQSSTLPDVNFLTSTPINEKGILQRGISQISNQATKLDIGERSMTNSFGSRVTASARIDTKTICDLEKRLENLQSILLRKVQILKNRSPEKVKKEYKFIALVMGNECKLVVNENEAKSFPDFLPAKSLEDLNRKAGEFFIACLLAFTDKIRTYQEEGRSIDCDAIYEELKKEEKDYCNILQDWISDFYDDADKTLTAVEQIAVKVNITDQEVQTESTDKPLDSLKSSNQEIQTDILFEEAIAAENKIFSAKLDKLRLENYELKDRISEESENHRQEIKKLQEEHERKLTEVMNSFKKDEADRSFKEDMCCKERKLNEDLSLQVIELRDQLRDLQERNYELSGQHQEVENIKSELEKCQIEYQRMQNENIEFQVWKSHFLKKLDQRNARIELQDKEIKIQKRTVQMKTEEIEKLRKDFDTKVKENRLNKESLEARNKLIDHLRNAVEIDQKKIREYELQLESVRGKSNDPTEDDKELEREAKMKRVHGAPMNSIRVKNFRKGSIFTDQLENDRLMSFNQTSEQESKASSSKRLERPKKQVYTNSQRDTTFDIKAFQDAIGIDSTPEMNKTPRDLRPRKRSRDIIVRKYEI